MGKSATFELQPGFGLVNRKMATADPPPSNTNPVHDPWVCPDDRQLALRGRLKTGWSIHSNKMSAPTTKKPSNATLTCEEQEQILAVIRRAEAMEQQEQERIGKLIDRLENMKKLTVGDGVTHCAFCGKEFGRVLGGSPQTCKDCGQGVCSKCGVDTADTKKRRIWLCKVCSEAREVWKKSGAWFFKGIPKYVVPEKKENGGIGNKRLASEGPRPAQATSPSIAVQSVANNNHDGSGMGESHNHLSPMREANPIRRASIGLWSFFGGASKEEPGDQSSQSVAQKAQAAAPVEEQTVLIQRGFSRKGHAVDTESESSFSARGSIDSSASEFSRYSSIGEPTPTPIRSVTSQKFDAPAFPAQSTSPVPPKQNDETLDLLIGEPVLHERPTRLVPELTFASSVGKKATNKSFRKSFRGISRPNGVHHVEPEESTVMESPEDDPSSLGYLEFDILYNPAQCTLQCNIIKARNLRAMDRNGFSDPYVKLHLLPGASKSNKQRTKTIHKTLNPVYNETLTYYGITEDDIERKVLRLAVLDEDTFGHDFIGEFRVQLRRLPPMEWKHFDVVLENRIPVLDRPDEIIEERGRILLSLMYSAKKTALVVGIVRCAALAACDRDGSSDPYVKIYLKPDPHKKTKNKTAVKKHTLNPEYNEEFTYPIKLTELLKKTLEITVWDRDFGKTNDYIGGLQLSINSKGERLKHWYEMISNAETKFERWHGLVEEDFHESS